MVNKNFLLIILAILLVFCMTGCPTDSGGSSNGNTVKAIMDGTWRRGNLDHYYQITIDGNKWEYAEGAAGHILGYTKGTWVSSKPKITAGSEGILTLVVDQTAETGSWRNYPETDFNLKTNAAYYELNAKADTLKISEAILDTAGLWAALGGDYTKQYEWGGWANANGASTITLSDTSGTFTMSGTIADGDDHWAGMGIFATDTETRNAMKTAKSISFDIKGSGEYELVLQTSDIQKQGERTGEWSWYRRIFTAPAAEETIKLNIEDFLQDGPYMPFKQNLWDGIQFSPVWDSRGPFNLTFGNVKVSDTADGMALPDWRWDSNAWDGGTVTLTEADGTVTITGNNDAGGFDWWASPNNGKTSNALKNAATLSFKADGTGDYRVKLRTAWGNDYSEVYSDFTLNGAEKTITLNISDFAAEGTQRPFEQIKAINIDFEPIGNGTFDLTISDLKMTGGNIPGTPVDEWNGLTVPSGTKGYEYYTSHGKSDVLQISPSGTAYGSNILEYDLSDNNGKNVKIEFSVDMYLESPGSIAWQINEDDGHPLVAGQWDEYAANTWHTIHGIFTTSQTHALGTGRVLYLSQQQLGNVTAYIANLSITITEIPDGTIELVLNPNGQWGWQVQYRPDTLLNGYQIKSGDSFTLSYEFTSDVALDKLTVYLVDNDDGGWNELSNRVDVQTSVAAGTTKTGTITLTATATAKNASTMANKLVLEAGTGTLSLATLTFTELTLTKN